MPASGGMAWIDPDVLFSLVHRCFFPSLLIFISHLHAQGYLYRMGHGVGKNLDKAIQLIRASAEQECGVGLLQLGQCYAKGEGVEFSEEEAFKCFQRAAVVGNKDAMLTLSLCYTKGRGTYSSSSLAAQWKAKAALLGQPAALKEFESDRTNVLGGSGSNIRIPKNEV